MPLHLTSSQQQQQHLNNSNDNGGLISDTSAATMIMEGPVEDTLLVVTQRLDITLQALIRRRLQERSAAPWFDINEIVCILTGLLDALAFLKKMRVVHRDMKAGVVMCCVCFSVLCLCGYCLHVDVWCTYLFDILIFF